MKHFLIALQFLTTIPIKIKPSLDKIPQSLIYFPAVGLFLGAILTIFNILLTGIHLPAFLVNVILVVSLIILTGSLHLDGLADTFDAFLSGKPKSEMLKIMRDSHIGTMGVLSLISVILLKIGLLGSLNPAAKNGSLLLMCVLSRYVLVFSIFKFPYARETGKAKIFFNNITIKTLSLSSLISLILAVILLKIKGIILFFMLLIFVFLLGKFITKKIGGLTGDSLGAITEITEVFILFFCLSL
ncbi:MAG: adenosylcobinamide-GDP ribazoletransferase [Candidatus Omnitrophota bacterium]|nr:adenosylcobinamide-GDP ribazoletransferase [Candidatus Omnitrophota bacterium]